MKGIRIINFFELWSIAGSRGSEISVPSTSFQINDNGWPQQPQTEKVLKFDMIFHDSTQKIFFSIHKNKTEFKYSFCRRLLRQVDVIFLKTG